MMHAAHAGRAEPREMHRATAAAPSSTGAGVPAPRRVSNGRSPGCSYSNRWHAPGCNVRSAPHSLPLFHWGPPPTSVGLHSQLHISRLSARGHSREFPEGYHVRVLIPDASYLKSSKKLDHALKSCVAIIRCFHVLLLPSGNQVSV